MYGRMLRALVRKKDSRMGTTLPQKISGKFCSQRHRHRFTVRFIEDRQRRLAMSRRALIFPDGNLSSVSIDEVCVTDILYY